MNEFDPSFLLMLEAAAPFLVLSAVLAIALMSGKNKMKKAARALILDVKANEKRERDALNDFLINKLNHDKKLTKKAIKKITNERKFLLRNIISGILDKNLEAIADLNQDLSRVCKQYHQLELAKNDETSEQPVEETGEEPNNENEKKLKKEIKNLKQEVHITLTTLNNIFKEFNSMFGEDLPSEEMSVDQIITAMEAFTNKDGGRVAAVQTLETNESEESRVEMEIEQETAVEFDVESQDEKDESELPDEVSISEQLDNILGDDDKTDDNLDTSTSDEIDDIDDALNMLELDSTDEEGEPDWGDAFAESGDVMEENKD